jgi:hypothetical protein
LPIDQRINIEQIEKIVKSLFEFVRNRIWRVYLFKVWFLGKNRKTFFTNEF